jgi:hypothetical protein
VRVFTGVKSGDCARTTYHSAKLSEQLRKQRRKRCKNVDDLATLIKWRVNKKIFAGKAAAAVTVKEAKKLFRPSPPHSSVSWSEHEQTEYAILISVYASITLQCEILPSSLGDSERAPLSVKEKEKHVEIVISALSIHTGEGVKEKKRRKHEAIDARKEGKPRFSYVPQQWLKLLVDSKNDEYRADCDNLNLEDFHTFLTRSHFTFLRHRLKRLSINLLLKY